MPTAVESIASLGAVLVQLPPAAPAHNVSNNEPTTIGGRSSVAGNFKPSGPSDSYLIGLLLPAVHDISVALQNAIPKSQKLIQILGVGTQPHIIAILIGLLKAQGFHATMASCDGSVRTGFSGPTAVLRAQGGGVVPNKFLQEVAAARNGH